MKFYAHTAQNEQGDPLPEPSGKWQPLSEHLRNVAALAGDFASSFGMKVEGEIADCLHDLGKYSERFQQRLRNPAIHGINHWAAGARKAAELRLAGADYCIDGHHTGLPEFSGLQQSLLRMGDRKSARELTGCAESVTELMDLFSRENGKFPVPEHFSSKDFFATALRTRMLFSALVDADFLDTEKHFQPDAARQRKVPELQPHDALALLQSHLHSNRRKAA